MAKDAGTCGREFGYRFVLQFPHPVLYPSLTCHDECIALARPEPTQSMSHGFSERSPCKGNPRLFRVSIGYCRIVSVDCRVKRNDPKPQSLPGYPLVWAGNTAPSFA
jgi:hypothetical protein